MGQIILYRVFRKYVRVAILTLILFLTFVLIIKNFDISLKPKGETTLTTPSPSPSCSPTDSVVKSKNSVVKIVSAEGSGSGFVVSPLGFIVTNYHVVAGSSSPHVVFPSKRTLRGEVFNWDENTDVAIVQVENSPPGSLPFGNSDKIFLGEDIYSIGFPYSELLEGEATVTKGSLSARRKIENENIEYIQTDAAINFGNSGGPTINICGEVIGINTLKFTEAEGIGFALASNSIKIIVDDLIAKGPRKLEDEGLLSLDPKLLGPEETVLLHYAYITKRELEKSYSLFSKRFKTEANYQEYEKGFETTVNLFLDKINTVDESTPRVFIEFVAVDIVNEKLVYTIYSGTWDLVFENGYWKLDRANISKIN